VVDHDDGPWTVDHGLLSMICGQVRYIVRKEVLMHILLVLIILLTISACSSSLEYPTIVYSTVTHPTFIHHAEPNLRIDTDWVEDAGCSLDQHGHYSGGLCSPDSPLRKLGCERIEVNHLFGGLPYPVVMCANDSLEPLGTDYTDAGCYLSHHTEALLTFRDGSYQFVGKEEITAMSVPIESPDEALSYILASTEYYEMYGIEIDSHYEYFATNVEDTFVEEKPEGYLLHLFYDIEPRCGCGDHYTESVDFLVQRDCRIK
jgi:hypothetical protein